MCNNSIKFNKLSYVRFKPTCVKRKNSILYYVTRRRFYCWLLYIKANTSRSNCQTIEHQLWIHHHTLFTFSHIVYFNNLSNPIHIIKCYSHSEIMDWNVGIFFFFFTTCYKSRSGAVENQFSNLHKLVGPIIIHRNNNNTINYKHLQQCGSGHWTFTIVLKIRGNTDQVCIKNNIGTTMSFCCGIL